MLNKIAIANLTSLLLPLAANCEEAQIATSEAEPYGGYTLDKPYGEQPQEIYFTKDMTIKLGTTEIGFYGFFLADYMTETRITGDTADIRLSAVPLNTDHPDRHTQTLLDARSTRLGFKVEDQINGVKIKGAVETDFFTSDGDAINSNGRVLRMRLAYGTAELPSHFFFLAGQYYAIPMPSPEMDMPTFININFYPAGSVKARVPQFRAGYKQYVSDIGILQYEGGVELQGYNQIGYPTSEGGLISQASEQIWPLAAAKISWLNDTFKWDISGAGTEASCVADSFGTRVTTPVWGIVSSGSFTWKNLLLWGTIHHWSALSGLSQAYLDQLALISLPGGTFKLRAHRVNGGTIALRYDFIKSKLWVDGFYGIEQGVEIPGSQFSGDAIKRIDDVRVNIIGAFWNRFQIGLQWERIGVKAYNGTPGLSQSGHLAVWYFFGQP